MKDEICGIYMIRNNVTGSIYIGQSVNIYGRWEEHLRALRGDYHFNNHLQSSWNKHKESSFEFSIVEQCTEAALDDKEIYWIDYYDSYKNGYNQTKGGGGVRGFKHSDETKQKISESTKGENAPWYGKQRSDVTKAKIGAASHDRWSNPENHPMYGKKHSEDSKAKMSEVHKGKVLTDEHKEKLRAASEGENNPMFGVRRYGKDNPNYGNHKLAGLNNPNCRSVYCPELDEVFWGAKEASEKYGIDAACITMCCSGKRKHAGKHPITGVLLRWCYNDERYKLNSTNYTDARLKAVYCIELDEYFDSASDAGRKYNININSISQCCLGNRKSAGRHPQTGEKLHWIYINEINNSFVA